jgi:hypothetical protein
MSLSLTVSIARIIEQTAQVDIELTSEEMTGSIQEVDKLVRERAFDEVDGSDWYDVPVEQWMAGFEVL